MLGLKSKFCPGGEKMNISKEAHDKAILEVAKEFNLSKYVDEAYKKAIVRYNGGGKEVGRFQIDIYNLDKLAHLSPFNEDKVYDCDDTFEWFEEVISQYLSSIGVNCESVWHISDYTGQCPRFAFCAIFKINLN
jgi:hypothetical protein